MKTIQVEVGNADGGHCLQPFSVLGSTGSIGTQTLDIVREHRDKFEIVGLAAGSNIDLFAEQIREFQPSLVAIRYALPQR